MMSLADHTSTFYVPSNASRSEKAIAALTLAMANGAGSLNDYADLQHTQETQAPDPALESSIGEMWH